MLRFLKEPDGKNVGGRFLGPNQFQQKATQRLCRLRKLILPKLDLFRAQFFLFFPSEKNIMTIFPKGLRFFFFVWVFPFQKSCKILRSVLQHLNDPFHRYDLTSRSYTHDEKRNMKDTRVSCCQVVSLRCPRELRLLKQLQTMRDLPQSTFQ